MPRPPKSRKVSFLPNLTYFKPAGVPLKELEEESLRYEELEAIRLKDLQGLEQEACAKRMGVSRPTFHRIITSARNKLARALVEGKAIRIEGGNYKLIIDHLRCSQCGYTVSPDTEKSIHEQDTISGNIAGDIKFKCNKCSSRLLADKRHRHNGRHGKNFR
ncbi:MAG: DUF134 domain-containing protein [Firmicutes bacterium]|jgi:predicted DNA-binding protein (UPF0251 family)|nr:DUF134 domain-containing protein [Bacillota bacterium]